jgi:Flp pilus assembly protein protease CpaA
MQYAKTIHVNAGCKDVTNAMTPNRLIVSLVFISGIAVAVIVTLLSQYICGLSSDFGELLPLLLPIIPVYSRDIVAISLCIARRNNI